MLIHRITSVHSRLKNYGDLNAGIRCFFQTGSGILLAVPPKSSFFSKIINNMHISSEIFEICALFHLAMRISDPCPSRVLAAMLAIIGHIKYKTNHKSCKRRAGGTFILL